MRTDRSQIRTITLLLTAVLLTPVFAQDPAPLTVKAPPFAVDMSLNYAMVALAVVQCIFILAMGGILRTLGGARAVADYLAKRKNRLLVLLPLFLLISGEASAQEYAGGTAPLSNVGLFWILLASNVFLFILLLVQVNLLRGMTRAFTGADAQPETARKLREAGSWEKRIMKLLTRQVEVEKEEDILMHHEYDGIRELDNVLPPWWVWLFYGTIAWGVIYLFNVHVAEIWPQQDEEYAQEMEQASADVATYMATLTNTVDENTVVASVDEGVIAAGKSVFTQLCSPCHGPDGAGFENSVGPNLTDAFWLHGGGAKNIFKTIKYGVPEKGMISWKSQLKPAEIAAIASYILSQAGKGGATQKEPQGEPWSEGPRSTTDTTATQSDTTRVAAVR